MAPLKAGGDQLALARAQLALGNVGLALEAFHAAQRANPNDPAPPAGIGDCYAAMGRYDIAESSYEVALALAPRDHALLLGLASILERSGNYGRAADIRAEAQRFQQTAQMMALQKAAAAPAAAPAQTASTGTITMELPPARPADQPEGDIGRISLPRLVVDNRLSASAAAAVIPAAAPSPAPPPAPPAREMTVAVQTAGPRLERLSSGEIALVTTTKPIWTPPARERKAVEAALRPPSDTVPALRRPTMMASAVRWVPLTGAPPKGVQVLNAAGRDGLAASARKILSGRGWRAVAIGNARAFRHTSVVLYPKSRAALGRSLAAQFGVKARMIETDRVVLLLGRDVIASIGAQRRA
jgi:tetratricopeptide (TPR) repeat protein